MELRPLRHSKALKAVGYDAPTRALQLLFRTGKLYEYLDVPPEVYDGLTTSAHPWTEWQTHIKATYDYRLLE